MLIKKHQIECIATEITGAGTTIEFKVTRSTTVTVMLTMNMNGTNASTQKTHIQKNATAITYDAFPTEHSLLFSFHHYFYPVSFFTHIVFTDIKISLGECFWTPILPCTKRFQWKIARVFVTSKMNGKPLKSVLEKQRENEIATREWEWEREREMDMNWKWEWKEKKNTDLNIFTWANCVRSTKMKIIYFHFYLRRKTMALECSLALWIQAKFLTKWELFFFSLLVYFTSVHAVIVHCHASLQSKSKEQKHDQ